MATLYTDQATPYAAQRPPEGDTVETSRAPRATGPTIFIWVAWALAAAFWAATMTTAIGILQATGDGVGQGPAVGAADAGGVSWGLINVVGAIVLGLALAYGLYRYATRDRRNDPITEAATHALYDDIEQHGDDASSRSPEAHKPEERDSYRAARRDLG